MLFSHTIILSRANSSYEKTRYSRFLADSSGPSARLARSLADPRRPSARLARFLADSSGPSARLARFLADSSGPSARLACIGKNKLSEILSLVIHPKTHSPHDARKSQPNQRPLNFV